MKKRGRGRPKKPPNEKRSERIDFWVTKPEARAIKKEARALGMSPSEYATHVLVKYRAMENRGDVGTIFDALTMADRAQTFALKLNDHIRERDEEIAQNRTTIVSLGDKLLDAEAREERLLSHLRFADVDPTFAPRVCDLIAPGETTPPAEGYWERFLDLNHEWALADRIPQKVGGGIWREHVYEFLRDRASEEEREAARRAFWPGPAIDRKRVEKGRARPF